eukprot:1878114-Rhodomonas_salina.5
MTLFSGRRFPVQMRLPLPTERQLLFTLQSSVVVASEAVSSSSTWAACGMSESPAASGTDRADMSAWWAAVASLPWVLRLSPILSMAYSAAVWMLTLRSTAECSAMASWIATMCCSPPLLDIAYRAFSTSVCLHTWSHSDNSVWGARGASVRGAHTTPLNSSDLDTPVTRQGLQRIVRSSDSERT